MTTLLSRAALRSSALRNLPTHPARTTIRNASSRSRYPGHPPPRSNRNSRVTTLAALGLVSGVLGAGAYYGYPLLFGQADIEAPSGIPQAEIEFEKKRKAPRNKEDNRNLISSQHAQVQASWENPGVYAWGSNAGRVVAPEDGKSTVVKTPRRIAWFDGMLLRDLKIDQEFGAAVTEAGDLVQWGKGYSPEDPRPQYTLRGKDIAKLAISRDRILALTKGGSVYSLPVARRDQLGGVKSEDEGSSWFSFWSSPGSNIHYRQIKPADLGWGEKVVDIASGQEHSLLLTSSGRLFSAASSSQAFPSKGQLGIPGLAFDTRPPGPVDQPHEIGTLKGFKVKKIATGDYHSLALDDEGRVFAFGDNSVGQLGFSPDVEVPAVDTPSLLPFNKLYKGTELTPKVTSIAAGGQNSFFTVDAARVAPAVSNEVIAPARALGKVVADTWATGEGLYGCLGTGRWTHISNGLSKIKALSGLFEWDEVANAVIPIRLARLSVGATHSAAVMDNVTYVDASGKTNENDTNWGADIVWWGGNEHYQLGNGKRNNANAPIYIAPLDGGAADAKAGRKGEEHRFQITPRQTVRLGKDGKGRRVSVEQRVECGRYVTAVYSGT